MAALLVGTLVTAACSGGDDGGDATTTTTTAPGDTPGDGTTAPADPTVEGTLAEVAIATQEIASVNQPTALAARPSTDDLYVTEQGGRVRLVRVTTAPDSDTPRYQLQITPVLDLSEEVVSQGEQGLLGLAFSSDGRKLYLYLTAQPDGRTRVIEYTLGDGTTVDRSSRRELLEVPQPFGNHNGGQLVTGPDGYLYIGLGDGGSSGDPQGNGQDPSTLLGTILRVDPEGGTDDGPAYAIPDGNPFASGEEGAPEVWLYGARNPWRFSFDLTTGDLWVADVGQGDREEINRLPATGGFDAGRGANLGWNAMEGTFEFEGTNPEGAVLPIHEYTHDDGCSITGGFVYRGQQIPALDGAYLYADYCEPGLRALQVDADAVIDERTWTDLGADQVQSFGQDQDGELFLLLAGGPILKITPAAG